MKKLKFPEVFHTHINLSGRSEIFGGFWENLSQMHLLPRHSFLFPSFSMLLPNPHLWSVQARTSEKHIFSDLEIGRDSAWLSFEAFSFGCFPLCQSHVCLSQVLSYWDEARLNDNWNGRVALVEVTLLDSGLPRFFAPPLPSHRFLFCAVLPTG